MERSPFAELYRRGAMKVMYIALGVFVATYVWIGEIPFGFMLIAFWLIAGLGSTMLVSLVNGIYSAKLDADLTVRRSIDAEASVILPQERLLGLGTIIFSAIATTAVCHLVKSWIY